MNEFWQNCLLVLREVSGLAPRRHAKLFGEICPQSRQRLSFALLPATTGVPVLPNSPALFYRPAEMRSARLPQSLRSHETHEGLSREAEGPSFHRQATQAELDRRSKTGLLPGLTFESYVTGHANQLAVTAAEHVAHTSGSQYNPLHVFGASGRGKTHLLHAIGHRYLELHPKAKVLCTGALVMVEELRRAQTQGERTLETIEDRYIGLDMLIVDDLQDIAAAHDIEQSLGCLLAARATAGRQTVFATDEGVKTLRRLGAPLAEQLSQGMSVSLDMPDQEMRTAILLTKAHDMRIELTDETAAFIAKRLKTNIRELEGALQQIVAFQRFQFAVPGQVTIEQAKAALHDLLLNEGAATVPRILRTVADYFKISKDDLISTKKSRRIALARQIAIYLAKELTQCSLPEIGAQFGGRDHASVAHAVRKIAQDRLCDDTLNHEIHVLEQMIRG